MSPSKPLPQIEFIALIAMLFAMVAFSVDAMLPALPQIAAEVSPGNDNKAQLVITSFLFGMGVGTLITGPLSDSFGRKPVIFGGAMLYSLGAWLAGNADSLETLLAARILQGLGVAAPRIVALAIIRDLYAGRRMAQIMSYAMLIFTLVPAIAPFLGAMIIDAFGWRSLFTAFVLFCLIATAWLMLRQPETLPPARRHPFRPAKLWAATKSCFTHRAFTLSVLAQGCTFAILFGTLSSKQQIFGQSFGRADSFPEWFALIAVLGGSASVLNARLVTALGMRRMIEIGFLGQAIIAALITMIGVSIGLPFALYLFWSVSIFFMVGLVIGNLNALAMEPLGDIAGLAASVIGAVATVMGVLLAIPIGQMFNGTPIPLAASIATLSLIGFLLVRRGMR